MGWYVLVMGGDIVRVREREAERGRFETGGRSREGREKVTLVDLLHMLAGGQGRTVLYACILLLTRTHAAVRSGYRCSRAGGEGG